MKAMHFVLLLSLPVALPAVEIKRGDSVDCVQAALGAPRGQLQKGNRQFLYYDRGEVEFQGGTVTRVALLTETEFSTQEARRAERAKRVREEQEIRLAQERATGEALKARKLADPAFQTAPVAYQVAYWEDFTRRYPGVPVAEELTLARLQLAAQREEMRAREAQAERLADLEARVADAEARADRAESNQRRVPYYSAFYGRSFGRHPFNLMPVDYRFSETPVPVIRPPAATAALLPGGLPNMFPGRLPNMWPGSFNGRGNHEAPRMDGNCDDDRNESRRPGGRSDTGSRRFAGRNRM